MATTLLGTAACSDGGIDETKFVTDGLIKANESDYTAEGVALITDGYTLSFESGGVQVKNGAGQTMFQQETPAMVNIMQQGNSLMSFDEFSFTGQYTAVKKNTSQRGLHLGGCSDAVIIFLNGSGLLLPKVHSA